MAMHRLRPGLLRQVVRKRAVPDAGGSAQSRHERQFTDTPPGLASMELPHHSSSMWPRATGGTLLPCRRGFDLVRVSAQAGAGVTRKCRVVQVSFRSGSAQGVLGSL